MTAVVDSGPARSGNPGVRVYLCNALLSFAWPHVRAHYTAPHYSITPHTPLLGTALTHRTKAQLDPRWVASRQQRPEMWSLWRPAEVASEVSKGLWRAAVC